MRSRVRTHTHAHACKIIAPTGIQTTELQAGALTDYATEALQFQTTTYPRAHTHPHTHTRTHMGVRTFSGYVCI